MSRSFARFIAVIALLACTGSVWGFDPASVYPENGFLFARVFVKDLLPQGDTWSKDLPEFGRIFEKTTSLASEKLGFNPTRDLHEIGLFITTDVDPSIRKPNHIAFFVRGTFQPDRIMAAVPDLLQGMGPKAQQFAIKDVKGKKVLSGPEFMAYFMDNETLLGGTPDVVEAVLEGKLALGKAPEALKATLTSARFFLSVDAKTLKEKSPKVKRDIEKAPPPVRVHLESLQQIVLSYENGTLRLKADFNQGESAAFVASTLEAFRNQGLLECETRLKNLEDGLEQATAIELLGKRRSQMLAFAAGKDLLKHLVAKADGTSFEASFLVPEVARSFVGNPAMLPMIGVLSAIAVPNFAKARDKARVANCFANQRILLGAIEMYNMDHEKMLTQLSEADAQEGGILLKNQYLREPINKPEPECSYYSEGDLSKNGKISCKKHGSVF